MAVSKSFTKKKKKVSINNINKKLSKRTNQNTFCLKCKSSLFIRKKSKCIKCSYAFLYNKVEF